MSEGIATRGGGCVKQSKTGKAGRLQHRCFTFASLSLAQRADPSFDVAFVAPAVILADGGVQGAAENSPS
jgi:hypothetical protein